MGHSLPLFSLFSSFQYTIDSKQMFNIYIIFCQWLDSNRGPLVLEATPLPTEPQPLPRAVSCCVYEMPKQKGQCMKEKFQICLTILHSPVEYSKWQGFKLERQNRFCFNEKRWATYVRKCVANTFKSRPMWSHWCVSVWKKAFLLF